MNDENVARSLYKYTYQTANGLQSRNSYLVHYLVVDFIYIFLFISEIYNAERKIQKKQIGICLHCASINAVAC